MENRLDAVSFYILSVNFMMAVSSGLRTLTFPLYAYALGYSPFEISLFYVVYYIVHLIFTYPFALLSQKVGASKVVPILSVADAVSIFLISFHTPTLFVISFVLLGLASALVPQLNSLIAHNFKDKLTKIYSRTIAATLAGNLVSQTLTAIFGQQGLFSTIYFSVGMMYIAFAAVSIFLLRGFKDINVELKVKYIPSRNLLVLSLLTFVAAFSSLIVARFIQIWFVEQSLSVFDVSVIYMMKSVIGMGASLLTEKVGENALLRPSVYISLAALSTVQVLLIYFPPPISVVSYVSASLTGPILATADNVIVTKILNELKEVENGFALMSTFRMVGEIFGTLGQGLLFTSGEYLVPFALGCGPGLPGARDGLGAVREDRRQERPFTRPRLDVAVLSHSVDHPPHEPIPQQQH